MTRRPLIAGNWKMNLTHVEAVELVRKLGAALPDAVHDVVEVAVLPAFPHLHPVRTVLATEQLRMVHGAQDLAPQDGGAYTGDVSGPMLAALGCRYVLVGHSERREHHHEDDALVNAKVHAALRHRLTPLVCVGEGLGVREQGRHVEHCRAQLDADLTAVTPAQVAASVIAYEPVWAIGTGRVATPDDAQQVCGALRERVAERCDAATAGAVRILYGGSVKADNVAELVARPDIDGALVGGASLDADEFSRLCAITAGRYRGSTDEHS
ncbi:triose-phosphate isomerase [Pseudonocardia acidicola]|uniref:Triosephosphate isomerase n=1 Tax=Pseudonocardia acidicola TaxID=2724939 RepID=A0ABX1SBJ4_9PSEU|nr:triose-phosphate isomerase [Pseudonocardia acidicola]NMH97726.1 triose-phosphate isomerase [Pseudonocardia acidicola]